MKEIPALLVALYFISSPIFAASVRVQIVDFGQGDGIVIRTPDMKIVVGGLGVLIAVSSGVLAMSSIDNHMELF